MDDLGFGFTGLMESMQTGKKYHCAEFLFHVNIVFLHFRVHVKQNIDCVKKAFAATNPVSSFTKIVTNI